MKKKRLFAILLALCVTFTMMPLTGSGEVAHAASLYTLTLPSTYVEGVPRNHTNYAEVNGKTYYSEYTGGGNTARVESGNEVKLSCYVNSGWIFESWKAEPAGKVEISNLCDTTFQMPESDLSITSTVKKLVSDVAVSQEGVLTCNAEAGHTLQVTVRQKTGNIEKKLLSSEKISAEDNKYTYDLKKAMDQHVKQNGALPEDDYPIFLSYFKGEVQQGYIEDAATYHYKGRLKKLTTPTNLRWDGFVGKWDPVENAANYTVGITESAPGSQFFLRSFTVTSPEIDLLALDKIQLKNGASYFFNVMANPAEDDTEYVQSDSSQSPYSENFQLISKIETNDKALEFGSIVEKGATPTGKALKVINSGTKAVQLNMPTSQNYVITYMGTPDTQGKIALAPRETAEFTVQPKDGLAVGKYDETLTISGSNEVSASVQLKFNVTKSGGSSGGSSGSSGGSGGKTPTTPTEPVKPAEPTQTGSATSTDFSDSTSTKGNETTTNVDKASGDKLVNSAVDNKSTEIIINTVTKNESASSGVKSSEVNLPAETLKDIAEKTDADITLKTDVGEIKLDNKAIQAIAEQAEGTGTGNEEPPTVSITAEKVKESAKEVRYELKVTTSNGKNISSFKGGKVSVTVNVPKSLKNKKIVCIYVDANGHYHKVEGKQNADGTYTFRTGHFSSYAVMEEAAADTAIAKQKSAVKKLNLKLGSKLVKTKDGKKGIRLNWSTASKIKLDGVQIFCSVKKNSGYGKKAFYTSTSSKYTNTAVKKGKRYYYKVRGYVTIDGEKVYTAYSNKAWRTVK